VGDPSSSSVDERRPSQRGRILIGCLAAAVAVVAIVGVLLVLAFRSVDWGPPARGLATPEDVRPLPDGAEVVGEYAECGGNGKGWHTCERRIRVRMTGKSQGELANLVADLYRSRGTRMDDLRSTKRYNADNPLYGWTDCMSSISKADGLCISINTPEDGSRLNRIPGPVAPDEVDVSAESFIYFI